MRLEYGSVLSFGLLRLFCTIATDYSSVRPVESEGLSFFCLIIALAFLVVAVLLASWVRPRKSRHARDRKGSEQALHVVPLSRWHRRSPCTHRKLLFQGSRCPPDLSVESAAHRQTWPDQPAKEHPMHLPASKATTQIIGAFTAALLLTQCTNSSPDSSSTASPTTESPASSSRTAFPTTESPITSPELSPTASPLESMLDSIPSPSDEAPSSTTLTQRGIGSLEVGPSLSQTDVEGYFGISLSPKNQDEFCRLAIAEDVGLAIVTDDYTATLAFIVENPDVRTAEDVGVGSSYGEVVAAYGDLVDVLDFPSQTGGPIIAVDDMAQPGADFTLESRLMAFDTDPDGTVTRVRVGMYPWATYTDYCSHDTAGITHTRTGWPLTRLTSQSDG